MTEPARHENGHRSPWGRDCPGWPWCNRPADELEAMAAEYEQMAADDDQFADLGQMAADIRDELARRT